MHHGNCCKDEDYVKSVQLNMDNIELISELADFYKVLGDTTRLRILNTLLQGEMCVGTITDVLQMSQPSVSHQLRLLKQARLIKARKEGKWVFYSIDDAHVQIIYEIGLTHLREAYRKN